MRLIYYVSADSTESTVKYEKFVNNPLKSYVSIQCTVGNKQSIGYKSIVWSEIEDLSPADILAQFKLKIDF